VRKAGVTLGCKNAPTLFVNFRLADLLPRELLDDWLRARDAFRAANPPPWDEVKIRTVAMQNRIPTTLRGANAALRANQSLQGSEVQVRALQEYHD